MEVADRLEDIRDLGVQVVAVSMSSPDGLKRYLGERSLPIPLLADPERHLYAALGLGRTTWGRILRPRVIWRYLKSIARGGKVRRIPEGEDALQLGGDFLLDRDRRLLWAYRSKDPTDRPAISDVLATIRHHGKSTPDERNN